MRIWPEAQLKNIASKITKGTTPTTLGFDFTQHGINFIKAESITRDGRIIDSTFAKISQQTHEALKRSQIETEDILVTIAGVYLGKIGIVNQHHVPANTNQAVAIVRLDKSKANTKFIKYFLLNPSTTSYLNMLCPQSAQPNLNLTQLGKLTFPLPLLLVQQKIAAVLSTYDDLIENNTRRIALLERMAEELYKEWFVRMRFPGHEQTRFVKGIPEGWVVNAIEDFCTVARGSSPRPINDQAYFQNGDIPWIKIADATASKMFIYRTKEYVNSHGASFSRKLSKGSLIIATSGTLGFCIFLGVEGCVHDGWMYLSGYKKNIKPSYMYYVINSFREHLNNLSYGAAIQNINTGILKKLLVFVPSINVLDSFYTHIEAIHSTIFSIGEKNLLLRQTRDRLLTRLISGKLSVEDLDIAFPPRMLDEA